MDVCSRIVDPPGDPCFPEWEVPKEKVSAPHGERSPRECWEKFQKDLNVNESAVSV